MNSMSPDVLIGSLAAVHFRFSFWDFGTLAADVDQDVKNGAVFLDRVLKDIVTPAVKPAVWMPGSNPCCQLSALLDTFLRSTTAL